MTSLVSSDALNMFSCFLWVPVAPLRPGISGYSSSVEQWKILCVKSFFWKTFQQSAWNIVKFFLFLFVHRHLNLESHSFLIFPFFPQLTNPWVWYRYSDSQLELFVCSMLSTNRRPTLCYCFTVVKCFDIWYLAALTMFEQRTVPSISALYVILRKWQMMVYINCLVTGWVQEVHRYYEHQAPFFSFVSLCLFFSCELMQNKRNTSGMTAIETLDWMYWMMLHISVCLVVANPNR